MNKPKLTIKNFGPVKDVAIALNRLIVFMGPQSSGKSTVAKVISFCLWLEKDIVFHQSASHVDEAFMRQYFTQYHFFANYFNPGWEIEYDSDVIYLHYAEGILECRTKEYLHRARISKNAYIPSERNCVAVTGLKTLEMEPNYQRSFIFDWLKTISRCTGSRSLDLQASLSLGLNVYYDEDRKTIVGHLHDSEKILDLAELSSGLQSIIPLLMTFENLTSWIFDSSDSLSFEKQEQLKESLARNFIGRKKPRGTTEAQAISGVGKENFARLVESMESLMSVKNNNSLPADIREIIDVRDNISTPAFSNIVIEEPDQNLFPQTQVDLIYYILSQVNAVGPRVRHLILTTHSPFILYALNNCLLGYSVGDEVRKYEVDELMSFASAWIDPDTVDIYEFHHGTFVGFNGEQNTAIQDSRGLVRRNYFDKAMKDIMTDFSSLLGLYPEE